VRRYQVSVPWQDGAQLRVEAFQVLMRDPAPPTFFVPLMCSVTFTAVVL
jgi:hypothetical protein